MNNKHNYLFVVYLVTCFIAILSLRLLSYLVVAKKTIHMPVRINNWSILKRRLPHFNICRPLKHESGFRKMSCIPSSHNQI